MKVVAIRHKKSLMVKGVRYQAGDEEKLDAVLDDKAKGRYQKLGIIDVAKKTPAKRKSNAKVQRDN